MNFQFTLYRYTSTLSCRSIAAVLYETDMDIGEARGSVATGQILENGRLDHTVEEKCEILSKYFVEKPYFMAVQQKADKLIRENQLPLQELTNLGLAKRT